MKIVVIGAGRVGARVLLQLKKNPSIEPILVDPRDEPYAIQRGIAPAIHYKVELSSIELGMIIAKELPELVLVTTSPEDLGKESVSGLDIYVESLGRELESVLRVPVIGVSRSYL